MCPGLPTTNLDPIRLFSMFKDSFWIMALLTMGHFSQVYPLFESLPTFEEGSGKWADTWLHTHHLFP